MGDIAILTQGTNFDIGISKEEIQKLQGKGDFLKHILHMLNQNHVQTRQLYFIRNKILMSYVKDKKQTFEPIVLPQSLTNHVLKLAHDEMGHIGSTKTYLLLKRLYY